MKKPSKKILRCLKEIITNEIYFKWLFKPLALDGIKGCTVRIHNSQSYGDLGKGYLIHICEEKKYQEGIDDWFTFLIKYDDFLRRFEIKRFQCEMVNVARLIDELKYN
jgi:hypothetical protein